MPETITRWCDKHSDESVHRPMRLSTDKRTGKENGSYYCPNVDSRDEAGNAKFCNFSIAPSYDPSATQRFAQSNRGPESERDAELIN